jgi:hypothetical protein
VACIAYSAKQKEEKYKSNEEVSSEDYKDSLDGQ